MGETASANTDMDYRNIERAIQPEEGQPEAGPEADNSLAFDPEQPLDIPKPKKEGRPAGTKDTCKRTRKKQRDTIRDVTSSTTTQYRSIPGQCGSLAFPFAGAIRSADGSRYGHIGRHYAGSHDSSCLCCESLEDATLGYMYAA